MQVKLTHRDPSVYPSLNVLERHRPIRLGAWNGADLRVSGDDIAKIHALVEIVDNCVKLRNLAPSMAPVLVNGSPVSEVELQHGNVVSIGKTRLEVEIYVPETVSRAIAPAAVPELASEELPTGLVAFRPAGEDAGLDAVLQQLTAGFSALLLANFKAAGEEKPPWLTDEDLLAEAPREQIGDNSLHVLAASDMPAEADDPADPDERSAAATRRLIELFHVLRAKAGAALLIGSGDKQAVLEQTKFRRGFYASPTGLELFLRQGSVALAQKLIEASHAILIATADEDWTLYANPKFVHSPADLNLAAEPAPISTAVSTPAAVIGR